MALGYGSGGSMEVQMTGPFAGGGGGSAAKLANISLPVTAWKGAESPFSQVVDVGEVSVNSRVDLHASVEQTEMMRIKRIAMTASNEAGVVTVYAIGNKPDRDIIIQASATEVIA